MSRSALADQIWAAMNENPLQLKDLAALVGRSPKDGSVRNALRQLVEAGDVERDGRAYLKVQTGLHSAAVVPAPCTSAPPIDESEPSELPDGIPAPPEGLGDDGREAWALAWGSNWSKAPDAATIAHLARLEDEAANMIVMIEQQGVTQKRPIVTPKGEIAGEEIVMHPGINELRKLDAQLVKIRAALGLDPSSRARLGVEMYDRRPDAIDELAEQRRRRRAAMRAAAGGVA